MGQVGTDMLSQNVGKLATNLCHIMFRNSRDLDATNWDVARLSDV